MANLKYVFIINDNQNRAINFLAQHTFKKEKIILNTTKRFNDIDFNGLLIYQHYYQSDQFLFFDNCSFGDTNEKGGKLLVQLFSQIINPVCNSHGWEIGWVFIRITNYEGKKATIDKLLTQYESKEEKENRIRETNDKSTSQIHFMNFGRTIILNKCFINSRYTLFGDNISHEAINCFKTDNNERYLYLCSSGILKEDYFERDSSTNKPWPKDYLDKNNILYFDYSKTGKDEDDKAQYIFLRKVERVQVLDCAFDNDIKREKYTDINYGEQNIIDIFDSNSYSGTDDGESFEERNSLDNAVKVYATFKIIGNSAFVPTNYNDAIVVDEDDLKKQLKGSTMRHFVLEGSTFYDKIIEKSGNIAWEAENALTVDEYRNSQHFINDDIPDSVLGIVGETNKELYYSDLVAYAFAKSHDILNKFLEKAEIDKRVNYGEYDVTRENKNVDIFIKNNHTGNKFILIIENKVLANFNDSELKSWDKFVNKKTKNTKIIDELNAEKDGYRLLHPENVKKTSQLSKYYFLGRYILKTQNVPDDDDHIKCLIICPEQYVESYNGKKDGHAYGEIYQTFSYKLISEAINEVLINPTDPPLDQNTIEIIKEIDRALKVHTSKDNILFVSRNKQRVVKKVNLLNTLRNEQQN